MISKTNIRGIPGVLPLGGVLAPMPARLPMSVASTLPRTGIVPASASQALLLSRGACKLAVALPLSAANEPARAADAAMLLMHAPPGMAADCATKLVEASASADMLVPSRAAAITSAAAPLADPGTATAGAFPSDEMPTSGEQLPSLRWTNVLLSAAAAAAWSVLLVVPSSAASGLAAEAA